jgi:hypothetical protein
MSTWYHYTTSAGIHGILKTKSFWATDYRFLNDATEFHYGLEIFDRILQVEKGRLNEASE